VQNNKYLAKISGWQEKQAMDPLSLGAAALVGKTLLHGAGVHVMQNLAMSKALKSKALGNHLSKGFTEGLKNVHDTGLKSKIKQGLIGASLPEINAMYSSVHSAGRAISPHLAALNLKQKAGLRMAVSGKMGSVLRRGMHQDPKIQAAYKEVQKHLPNLPAMPVSSPGPIKSRISNVLNSPGKSQSAILNNLLPAISKGSKVDMQKFTPGARPSSRPGLIGGAILGAVDPVTSGVNTAKNLLNTSRVAGSRLGRFLHKKVTDSTISKPFRKGLSSAPISKMDKIKDAGTSTFISPIPVESKRLGSSLKSIFNKSP